MTELSERYAGYIIEALRDTDRELYGDDGLKETVARLAEQRHGTFNGDVFYEAFVDVTRDARVAPVVGRGIETYWRSVEAADA